MNRKYRRTALFSLSSCLGHKIHFYCDSFRQNPLFFLMRKLNNNTALLQKTIEKNWKFALSIRNFTLRLA